MEPVTISGPPATPRAARPARRDGTLRRFRRDVPAMTGAVLLGLFVLAAVCKPWIMPRDPDAQDLGHAFAAPFSPGHLLGTDNLGRDVASRLIAADQVALRAALTAVVVAMAVGIPLGFVAAYFGRWADMVILRITDALQSLPPLMLAIALLGAIGPGLTNAMVVIGLVFAPAFLRLVRASTAEVLRESYVDASRAIGTSAVRLVATRVLPNAFPPVLVQISIVTGLALIAEASLSLLGLGVTPPAASWGLMISQGYNFLYQQPWLVVLPGLTLAVAVLALNLVGDGVRDALGRGSGARR
ncbi:ABC transporter permease [Amycolatopsis acidicola]|uniref:ABC transporter permease n=1 Tax=Amycolatopsis acidicola TaxID=2596893 RepID=A0A5N0UTS5_9PSEU|nr:ABC transporter permease [Amycolatopsis acidicola]KAA9153450.1 ABC transporter permease [Amycolatopsis acidicola]